MRRQECNSHAAGNSCAKRAKDCCRARQWRSQVVCRVAAEQGWQQQQRAALLYDFHDRLIPYEKAWSWQKQRVSELCSADTGDKRDTVFLLQHPPVYTLGAGSNEGHLKFDVNQPPHPLYRTERGGEVTYHGPGQLVMYPVLDLTRHTQDLHWYLRGLEEVIIRALTATSGLDGQRIEGLTGVWVDGHKLAAIGVRARKWVTYHGLALNVSTDLQPFRQITPCGISDRPVGSVRTALGLDPTSPRINAATADQGTSSSISSHHSSSNGSSGRAQSSSTTSTSDSTRSSSDPETSVTGWDAADATSSSSSSSSSSSLRNPDISNVDLQAIVADPLIVEYRYALVEALEDVFGLQLHPASQLEMQELWDSSSGSSSSGGRGSSEQGPFTTPVIGNAQAPGMHGLAAAQ